MTAALRRQIADLGDKLVRQDQRHRREVQQLRGDLTATETALAEAQAQIDALMPPDEGNPPA